MIGDRFDGFGRADDGRRMNDMLRLIDANLDRLGEGLRVLEDIARFHLDDAPLSRQLKDLRHEMVTVSEGLKVNLLAARESAADVGRERISAVGSDRRHVADLVIANAKRAQESLRVLEECVKLPEMPLELKARGFERARFDLYEIEKRLSLKLSRKHAREQIAGVYVIIDTETLAGRNATEVARQAIAGGARVLQLRDKQSHKPDTIAIARQIKEICIQANVPLIINDLVDVALAIDADGVHLGQDDLPVAAAIALLPHKIIGCSARTVAQAFQAQAEDADYVGVGAVCATTTKPDAEAIGIEGVQAVREAISLPVVAIGGINRNNIESVMQAGADAAAVISAVLTHDIAAATRELVSKITEKECE